MPRNNKNLVAKDIDGKKIREQYFDGLLIGVFIFAICYIIWCLFDIKNFRICKIQKIHKMISAVSGCSLFKRCCPLVRSMV